MRLRERWRAAVRAFRAPTAELPDDAPLPDPLADEFDRLRRAAERQRWEAWKAHCDAVGDVSTTVLTALSGEKWEIPEYPPMPHDWRPNHAPA